MIRYNEGQLHPISTISQALELSILLFRAFTQLITLFDARPVCLACCSGPFFL